MAQGFKAGAVWCFREAPRFEGRLIYEVVEKTADGLRPRRIENEEPTGLLVTTTAIKLHPENETRRLSLRVTDTNEPPKEYYSPSQKIRRAK